MFDFQQKRKLRSVAYNRVTLIILAIFVLLSVRSVWTVYQKQRESAVFEAQAEERLNTLVAQQNELHGDITRLSTPEGVETEIRSKFNVVKNKENMVIIVDDTATTTNVNMQKSLWQKFLNLF